MTQKPFRSEPDEGLSALVARLAEADGPADEAGVWSEALWGLVVGAGAVGWSLPRSLGGEECDRPTLVGRDAQVAQGSLTAAFILSQHDAGVRRLLAASDREGARHWLGEIAAGRAFAAQGVSQLATSRRHGTQVLKASEVAPGSSAWTA